MLAASRWSDRIVTAGLVVLMLAGPMAFGAVHRWAFVALELGVCAMVVAAGLKIWSERPARPRLALEKKQWIGLAIPGSLLTALLLFQLTPLPPRMMHALAPATYRVYQLSFPGWPFLSPYQALAPLWRGDPQTPRRDAVAPATMPSPFSSSIRHWRTLTLAPSVTASALIEWVAVAALFGVVLLYPFGLIGETEAEARFYRRFEFAAIATAGLLATVALVQLAKWNGKLLWFFVPADWGRPMIGVAARASGPFVDPDHFADYVAMLLPTVTMAALFPSASIRQKSRANLQLVAALVALTVGLALLLSLSRGGWLAAALGTATALLLTLRRKAIAKPSSVRFSGLSMVYAAVGLSLFGLVLLYAAGPLGRAMVANRLNRTIAGDVSITHRLVASRDTLGMVAEFPLFGVGLGGWPDLYPHYRRPPWSPFFARQVGDDYIQLVAETGLIGSALVGWLVCAIFVRLHRGTRNLAPREFSRFAGVCGGIMAAMVHEVFDFSLRTPANAFLFAILSAIALRLALTHDRDSQPQIAVRGTRFSYLTTCILCLGALVLGVATATQDGSAYPYEVAGTRSLSDAAAFLVAHPAMAAAHLRLIDQSQRPLPADIELKQLTAAVWLDPNSPVARDAYARRMLGSGRKAAGLREVTESVYRAPQADLHTYLAPQLVPWLLPEEQDAIQTGFRRAVAARFGGALSAMLTFFDTLGRYADSARLSEQAAQSATNPTDKLEYLLFAGRTYAEAGDQASAFRTLTEALALAPTDPTPYVELARDVYGPSRQIHQLQLTIEAGKRAGADPFALDLALADGAQLANDHVAAEAALVEAQSYRADFDTTMRLGTLYLNDQDFARAVIAFEHAVDLKPDSPAAWSTLGEAEEAQYDYGAATKAYARAHALAPGDVRLAEAYENFQHRIADSPPAFGTTTGATPNR